IVSGPGRVPEAATEPLKADRDSLLSTSRRRNRDRGRSSRGGRVFACCVDSWSLAGRLIEPFLLHVHNGLHCGCNGRNSTQDHHPALQCLAVSVSALLGQVLIEHANSVGKHSVSRVLLHYFNEPLGNQYADQRANPLQHLIGCGVTNPTALIQSVAIITASIVRPSWSIESLTIACKTSMRSLRSNWRRLNRPSRRSSRRATRL
ncbi:hypothetical protein L0Z25_29615, partial [Burkholderia multivorans]|uniref:hypothetical protein n=1 Tax=Burkholderia multivorans TaxID=87883 RepID=UPI00207CDE90